MNFEYNSLEAKPFRITKIQVLSRLQMLYKPNFCCNCGEKIERIEWNLLTSRRFCAVCSAEHRRHDYFPRVAVTAGALAVMFGFGSLWAGTSRDEARIPAAPVSIRSAMPAAPPVTERSEAIVSAPEQEAPDQATAKQGLPAISDRNVAAH